MLGCEVSDRKRYIRLDCGLTSWLYAAEAACFAASAQGGASANLYDKDEPLKRAQRRGSEAKRRVFLLLKEVMFGERKTKERMLTNIRFALAKSKLGKTRGLTRKERGMVVKAEGAADGQASERHKASPQPFTRPATAKRLSTAGRASSYPSCVQGGEVRRWKKGEQLVGSGVGPVSIVKAKGVVISRTSDTNPHIHSPIVHRRPSMVSKERANLPYSAVRSTANIEETSTSGPEVLAIPGTLEQYVASVCRRTRNPFALPKRVIRDDEQVYGPNSQWTRPGLRDSTKADIAQGSMTMP